MKSEREVRSFLEARQTPRRDPDIVTGSADRRNILERIGHHLYSPEGGREKARQRGRERRAKGREAYLTGIARLLGAGGDDEDR